MKITAPLPRRSAPSFSSPAPESVITKSPPRFDDSRFEVGGSKQSRPPARATPPGRIPPRQRLANIRRVLPQLNPIQELGATNCPATAAAVDRYLRTGEVRAAPRGNGTSTFTWRTPPGVGDGFVSTSPADLVRRLRPGEHAVIRGVRPPESQFRDNHFFVIANTPRGLEVIDAYNNVVSSNVAEYLRQNEIASIQRFSAGAFEVQESSL